MTHPKRLLALLLAALLLPTLLAGCGQGAGEATAAEADDGRLRVVSTIFPPYDFVREVAGEAVQLQMLLPPGAESHSYEPTPQDIITIQSCDVFLYAGGESDAWMEDILDSLDTSAITLLSLMELVEAKEERIVEGMEHEEEAHEPELDEHVWTSPKNAALIVQAIADTLAGLDPDHAQGYRENAGAYLARLAELDAAFEAAVAGGARKALVFGDRFPFRYLADAYGLEYYAAFPGCSTQTEPSANTVAFLIDKVREEGIPVVFHIEQSNEKMADIICEDTGAAKRLMHSCHTVSEEDMAAGASYLTLMEQNADALREALQ